MYKSKALARLSKIWPYRWGGLRLGGWTLFAVGLGDSFCILTGQPSMVLPPGLWLYPSMHRQMAAPEDATSQLVFSPQGEGEQAD